MSSTASLRAPPHVLSLLAELHAASLAQEASLKAAGGGYEALQSTLRASGAEAHHAAHAAEMRDKFIALEEDKALAVAQVVRATGALNVLELGTSFGVSTIYLALVVGQNAAAAGTADARVIATEHEPAKAAAARRNWERAGAKDVGRWIELREGDALVSLKDVPRIDFVLFDIWTPMVLPLLKLVEPKLKPGAVLILDNPISSADGYKDYFDYINAPNSPYTTVTLPYENGLEMTVYRPAATT